MEEQVQNASDIAERMTGPVSVRIDGKVVPLVLDHNALITVERETGYNVLYGEINILKPNAVLTRALLYAALKRSGVEIALDKVGDMITPKNVFHLHRILLQAWTNSMPDAEEASEDGRPLIAEDGSLTLR